MLAKCMEKESLSVPMGKFWCRITVSEKYRWLRHVLFLLFFLPIILQAPEDQEFIGNAGIYVALGFVSYVVGFLYLNGYCLVPKYLLQGRVYSYMVLMLFLGIFTFLVICIADKYLNGFRLSPKRLGDKQFLSSMMEFLIIYSILVAAATGVKLFQHWLRNVDRFYRIQQASMQQELSMLKSQINPHFLFNIFNNVNILITADPHRAAGLLSGLSDLLRYQIYDCAEESVLLSADIQFLRDFLMLESSRRDDFSYVVNRKGKGCDIMLPPFLFIPFVENAVKHNRNAHDYIHIMIDLQDNELKFECENSRTATDEKNKKHIGGLGLANIRRRLKLLYPEQHELIINETKDTFNVKLWIKL